MSQTETARLLERALRQIRKVKADIAALQRPISARCPVAVVGLACRVPGADSPEAYWQLLCDRVDATRDIPPERWDADRWYDPDPDAPGKMYVRSGGFVRDITAFDSVFFGISPREAFSLDPQQRLVLETAWEALEHAAIPPSRLSGTRTGVYLGVGANEYSLRLRHLIEDGIDSFAGTSNALSVIAGRVAYTFGLSGPAVALDTACSSSLVAIYQAVRSLQVGDCDAALAGGVNVIISPDTMLAMARMHMLSRHGQCRSFDASADGFARGEGCGVLVLKRLADAQRDGDRVLAVVRGAAVNQDGRSAGLTAPNKHAQVAAIRAALADGAIDPLSVSYIESHGTGTELGDPIEMGALQEALCAGRGADRPLIVGAAKSNLGHLEAASGVAGAIKAILAIQRGEIPANLHFDSPNPHIPWEELPVVIPVAQTPWRSPERIVGINSFGFSGTNAHLVLGPAPDVAPAASFRPRPAEILPLSARTRGALSALALRYADQLARRPEDWPHLACTASVGREAMPHRGTVLASSAAEAAARLRALAESAAGEERPAPGVAVCQVSAAHRPSVAFLFTGQGAQLAGAGRQLYAEEPAFAEVIDRCEAALGDALPLPLRRVLFDEESPIDQTRYTQPAIFALQVALAALWRSLGVHPQVVVGHSLGAYAAAVVAGVMRLEDGLSLVATRGRLMGALPAGGAMAAVSAPERRVLAAARRDRGWCIAAVNGPEETVISGEAAAVDAAVAAFQAEGLRARRLEVSHAFHSPLMTPILPAFRAAAAAVAMAPPELRFIDETTGALRPRAPTAEDWCAHLQEPVRFADALRTLAGEGCDTWVEIGPRPALLGMARSALGDAVGALLPSMRPGQERARFDESLAALWCSGLPVQWAARFEGRGYRPVDAPTYPFQHQRFWPDAPRDQPAKAPTGQRDTYALRWRPQPGAAPRPLGGAWLVLRDEGGVGEAVAAALEAEGLTVARCAGADPAAIAARVAERPWAGILDLAALDARLPSPDDPEDKDYDAIFADARRRTCDGVLAAAQGLARARATGTRLWLVTRRAVSIGGEPPAPAQALRWGLGRVLAVEQPDLFGGLIDLDLGSAAEAAEALIDALARDDAEGQVALRGGTRWVARLTRQAPDPLPEGAATWDQPGTLLITGGLGDLGMALAGHLVERGARHLALMGRQAPSEGARARIVAWQQAGATVQVAQGDVSRLADVVRVVSAINAEGPPLAGVIHCAGVLDDGLLLDQTAARFDRALAPKVLGAWNLHTATAQAGLRLFVLYSSIAGLVGSPGQGNYAAGNAFLDALAGLRAAQGEAARSIAWGPWAEVGMAARAKAARRSRGGEGLVAPLPPADALAALDGLLGQRGAAVAVMRLMPLAGEAPPLFAELVSEAPEAAAAAPVEPPGGALTRLRARPTAERPAEILALLLRLIGAALGIDPSTLDPGQSVIDLGMDSMLVMEVIQGLKRELTLTVYPREFYQQPSIDAMAAYLLGELERTGDAHARAASPEPELEADLVMGGLDVRPDLSLRPPSPISGVGFVLSAPRSGSTLLRVMLAGHPGVFAPPELWLLQADDMAVRQRNLAPLDLDQGYTIGVREALRCSTEEAEERVGELVAAAAPFWTAYERLRDWAGGRLLLDKTPWYSRQEGILRRVDDCFHAPPIIHLIRHPLAVIESWVKLRLDRIAYRGDLDPWYTGEGTWLTSVQNVLDLEARGRCATVHQVRFEALVQRPRETLEALTAALGLPFDEATLRPHEGGRMLTGLREAALSLGDQNFRARSAIDPSLADAWRGVNPPRPLDEKTRALADFLGYELPARRDQVAVPAAPREETPVAGPRAGRVAVGRLSLETLSWGPEEGPLVLAVHGLLDHAGVWAPVAERLAAQGARVVAPDLRGHGASEHLGLESDYTPLDHVQDLACVVAQLGRPPAVVVGHSMGATVAALYAAARGPAPLVLLDPPMPTPQGFGAEDLARWLDVRGSAAPHPVFASLDEAIARLARGLPGVPEPLVAALARRAIRPAAGGLTWRWDARLRLRAGGASGVLTQGAWLALLGALSPPPTLVFAEDSALVRPEDRARQQAAAQGTNLILPGGHHLQLTAPEAVVDLLLRSLGHPA